MGQARVIGDACRRREQAEGDERVYPGVTGGSSPPGL